MSEHVSGDPVAQHEEPPTGSSTLPFDAAPELLEVSSRADRAR